MTTAVKDDRYDRVDRNGKLDPNGHYDKYTLFNLRRVEQILGFVLWVVQGGYNKGGVAASGGTHDGGGPLDISIRGMSATTIALVVKTLRKCGFAAWYRPPNWDNRGGGAHIHAVLIGNAMASDAAKSQWGAFRRWLNGLANGAADRTWHPAKIVNAPYKVYKIRYGHWNLPAPGVGSGPDLGNDAARIKSAAAQVKKASLAFITWNELGGIQKPHVASQFAHDLDDALGSNFNLVKPTLELNENYISYDKKKIRLVKQYPDLVLPSSSGGRHLTRGIFEDLADPGFYFGIGVPHLVSGSSDKNEKDRQIQGGAVLKGMQEMSQDYNDCPFVISGDMNTPHGLEKLAKMKRTRIFADTSTTRNTQTFVNYWKPVPETLKSAKWIIDHSYVTNAFYVIGYSVRWVFKKPRASDHALIVNSVSH